MRISTQIFCVVGVFAVVLGGAFQARGGLGDFGKVVKIGKKLADEDKEKKEGKSKEAGDAASPAKAEPGNIVFSAQPIPSDKADKLTAAFQAGDSIYARVFPKTSFRDMAKGASSTHLEFKCFLDGQYATAGSYSVKLRGDALKRSALTLDLAPEADKMTAYDDKDVVYKDVFAKYGKRAGPMQFTKFLSTLKPGKHTIKIVAYHYGDMAVGTFTITGKDFKGAYDKRFAALEAKNTQGVKMPEPKMTDKKLEGEMYQALKNSQVKEARDGEVLQIIILDPDWHMDRHKISGAILKRHIRAVAAIQEKNGTCWMWRFTFKQPYISEKFQKTKLDGIYEREKIPVANVQKEAFE